MNNERKEIISLCVITTRKRQKENLYAIETITKKESDNYKNSWKHKPIIYILKDDVESKYIEKKLKEKLGIPQFAEKNISWYNATLNHIYLLNELISRDIDNHYYFYKIVISGYQNEFAPFFQKNLKTKIPIEDGYTATKMFCNIQKYLDRIIKYIYIDHYGLNIQKIENERRIKRNNNNYRFFVYFPSDFKSFDNDLNEFKKQNI